MGIELKAQGDVFAADGWRMAWNLDITQCGPASRAALGGRAPQQIDVWNADGVPQYTISGTIDKRKLEREIRQFMLEREAFVQGRLVALWPLMPQLEAMVDGH